MFSLKTSINKILRFLSCIVAFLIVAGWSTQFYASIYKPGEFQTKDCHGIIRLFYLDGEANIPAWYQSATLLVCAFLLAVIYEKKRDSTWSRHWQLMSCTFLFLSLDEAACIHESVGSLLSHVFHTTGLFTYAWVIPGGVFAIVFFLSSVRFLLQLPPRTRRAFVIAGAMYVSGALGWEMIGGWYDSLYGARNMTYMTLTVFEEAFECIGVLLFIHAILTYLKENQNRRISKTIIPDSPLREFHVFDVTLQD